MKIGVFGDSFAWPKNAITGIIPNQKDESWIQHIQDKGYKIVTYGLGGTSTFFSYKNFLKYFKQFEAVIFLYSSRFRIPTMPKTFEGFSCYNTVDSIDEIIRFRNKNLEAEEIKKIRAIFEAFEATFDEEFYKFIQQSIFNEVNRLCNKNNIRLVNILSFERNTNSSPFLDYDRRYGEVVLNLSDVSMKEMKVDSRGDVRYCHLSYENNKILGDKLLELIQNKNSNKIIDAYEQFPFVYSDEITQRYYTLLEQFL